MVLLLLPALPSPEYLPETPPPAAKDRSFDDRGANKFRPYRPHRFGGRRALYFAFAGDPEANGVQGGLRTGSGESRTER